MSTHTSTDPNAPLAQVGLPEDGGMNIVDQFKKGYKTSEFWVGLITLLGPPIAVFSGYKFDVEGAVTVIGSVFAAITYIGSRTWLKRKRIDAVVNPPA